MYPGLKKANLSGVSPIAGLPAFVSLWGLVILVLFLIWPVKNAVGGVTVTYDAQWYADNVPSGHWKEISINVPSDIDPCPENTCSYSHNSKAKAVITAWNGAAFADGYGALGSYLLGPGGGHEAYDGDEFYVFDLSTRLWTRPYDPSDPVGPYDEVNGEGRLDRPVATHTYGLQGWHPTLGGPNGSLIMFGSARNADSGGTTLRTHYYPLGRTNGEWERLDHPTGLTGTGGAVVWDPVRDNWLMLLAGGTRRFDVNAPSGEQFLGFSSKPWGIDMAAAVDPGRDIAVILDFRNASARTNDGVYVTDLETRTHTKVNTSGGPDDLELTSQLGFEFVPDLGGFVAYRGRGESVAYLLKPPQGDLLTGVWQWSVLNAADTNEVTPGAMRDGVQGRIFTRFQWVPRLKLFLLIQRYGGPVYAYRPPGVSAPDSTDPSLYFSANATELEAEEDLTLTWGASNVSDCSASGGWSGAKPLSGTEVFSDLQSSATYTLTCSGTGGTIAQTITVNVNSPPQSVTSDFCIPITTESANLTVVCF